MPTATKEDLAGGSAAENAAMIERLLGGEPGPRRDIVLLNAGAALLVAGATESLARGVESATAAIESGKARATLDRLRQVCGS
jgi:anthranilate phosphoribosyltransferase